MSIKATSLGNAICGNPEFETPPPKKKQKSLDHKLVVEIKDSIFTFFWENLGSFLYIYINNLYIYIYYKTRWDVADNRVPSRHHCSAREIAPHVHLN